MAKLGLNYSENCMNTREVIYLSKDKKKPIFDLSSKLANFSQDSDNEFHKKQSH